jgi:hypothetical protein
MQPHFNCPRDPSSLFCLFIAKLKGRFVNTTGNWIIADYNPSGTWQTISLLSATCKTLGKIKTLDK